MVPTNESGRRLREYLVNHVSQEGSGAILGPRSATPSSFFRGETAMPDGVRWAGWLQVLRATTDDQVSHLFPSELSGKNDAWRVAMIRRIELARDTLISGNADFTTVAAKLSQDKERWTELAQLEEKVAAVWNEWGFSDPARAKQQAAMNPHCPQGVEEIIIAGVADPTQLAIDAWQRLLDRGTPVTVLVGAPESLMSAFDAWGRPIADFWTDREKFQTPEPGVARLAADSTAMADEVVRLCVGKKNTEMAVGACDPSYVPAIQRRFREAGWVAFDPEGDSLAKDGWPELFSALSEAVASPNEFSKLARLARHPVIWNDQAGKHSGMRTLAVLDDLESEHALGNSKVAIEHLSQSEWNEEQHSGLYLAAVLKLLTDAPQGTPEGLSADITRWLAGATSDVARRGVAEIAAWPTLKEKGFDLSLRLQWLSATLASLTAKTSPAGAVLPLQGWLELPYDPAPHLILAGLHEGCVPEPPRADPLISEAVCENLGLKDRRSRLAREIFLYAALVEGRRASGSVTVLTAQVDAEGEPCRPSRVLLQADGQDLAPRVREYIKDEPDVPTQPTPPWSRGGWRLRPPAGTKGNRAWAHVSPSALKAYLACPTRFYFSKVLRWEEQEPFDGELSPAGFGELIHSVLRAWGEDKKARELATPEDLKACWRDLLKRQTKATFGPQISPQVQLQIMSAEERLMSLADRQAEQRKEGWHIVEVETELNGVIQLAGLPVHMKVDRIDRHDDGRMRVIDYKTGNKGTEPRTAHLAKWAEEKRPPKLGPLYTVPAEGRRRESVCGWTDLQLPLYAEAVRKKWGTTQLPECCYAILPMSIRDTSFVSFTELASPGTIENALEWAEEAAKRIRDGVFWPPAPEIKYDLFETIAPDGLTQALSEEWVTLLSGPSARKGKGGA